MRTPGEELEAIRRENLYRRPRTIEDANGPEMVSNGRKLIQFASNDYLGLASSTELRAAFQEAAGRWGAGSGASRLITGTQVPHLRLEEDLAAFKRTERALAFSSGYATALGTLTSILGKDDFVILDKLCHACLIDGARLSAATIRVFPHNDLEKLEHHLAWAREKSQPSSRILVVTESVFSMDGDRAPLREIVELKDRHGALLMVDEAHAVGVTGPHGRGLADELGVADRVDLQMGTLSKALGVSGGYLCASQDWIELIANRARSWIYSTAPPPSLAAAASAALELSMGAEGDRRRRDLWENIATLDASLQRPEAGASAISPHMVGEPEAALRLSAELEARGFLVPAIRFPTVPRGTARLRISLSALHRPEQIHSLAENLAAAAAATTMGAGRG